MITRDAAVSPNRERSAFNQTLQTAHVEPTARIHTNADFGTFLIVFLLCACFTQLVRGHRRTTFLAKRRHCIETYVFPPEVLDALRRTWPELRDWQIAMAQRALRSFFIAHLDAGPDKVLAMPSKVADALWHAFILDTCAYHAFCDSAFGRYFHHLPDYRMADGPASRSVSAIDALWRSTCEQAGIDPRCATRLPILFELDRLLRLPDAPRHDPVALSHGYDARRGRFDFVFEIDLSGCGGGGDGGDGGCGGGGD